MSDLASGGGMTLAELEIADSLWPDVGPSPWASSWYPSWPGEFSPARRPVEFARRLEARTEARARILSLRGRALERRGEREVVIYVVDASRGAGGIHLGYRNLVHWEPLTTRDLRGFESIDGVAREVLAFVAVQIERDHHLGEHARGACAIPGADPPRDAHLSHLRAFMRSRRCFLEGRSREESQA